jgi:ribA/ribD-fused uncharacterized protein
MPKLQVISRFYGEYAFLSNFYECEVMYDGILFPTAEHAYQAAKTTFQHQRLAILNCETPGQAKRMGRRVSLRDGWDEMKIDAMRRIVRDKFKRNPALCKRLIETGDRDLVEGNYWGDNFWGKANSDGLNWLGKILMEVREELS